MAALGHNRKSVTATRTSGAGGRADIIRAKADIASPRSARDLPSDHTAPGRAPTPLQRPAPHRRRQEVEHGRERDDGGEAEFDGEERRQDRTHDRGAAVDAPGPGHQLRQLAPRLSPRELTLTLTDAAKDRLADLGPSALTEALEILAEDSHSGIPQNPSEVTRAPKLLREHGRLDLSQPAEALERKIRAYHPWPGTFTEVSVKGKTKRLKIFPPVEIREHSLPTGELLQHEGELLIGCDEKSLALFEVQPEGSKRMPAAAFANRI